MPDIVLYFIKVNIALALFYAAYRLFLYRLTFYNLNRFYLLFGLMFSAVYPFADLSGLWMTERMITVSNGTVMMDWQQLPRPATASSVWLYVIVLGALVMLTLAVRMLVRLISLWRIHRCSYGATWRSVRYREMPDPVSPFSFWKQIYVHTPGHQEQELAAIFRHEQEHVRQLHSLDILLAEAASVMCWYNPCGRNKRIRQNPVPSIPAEAVCPGGHDAYFAGRLLPAGNYPHPRREHVP